MTEKKPNQHFLIFVLILIVTATLVILYFEMSFLRQYKTELIHGNIPIVSPYHPKENNTAKPKFNENSQPIYNTPDRPKFKNNLVPLSPEEAGFVTIQTKHRPRTYAQTKLFVNDLFEDSDIAEKKKRLQNDPKFIKTVDEFDAHIQKIEEKLRQDPSMLDDKEGVLQDLYFQKAIYEHFLER